MNKQKTFKRIVASVLATITAASAFVTSIPSAAAASSSPYVEYLGQVTAGSFGTTLGKFKFTQDGKTYNAFCANNHEGTPATGAAYNRLQTINNEKIRKALYYGAYGEKNIFGNNGNAAFIATSSVISRLYSGSSYGQSLPEHIKLWNVVNNSNYTVPSADSVKVSKSNLSVKIAKNHNATQVQRTENVTISGSDATVAVPDHVYLHTTNEASGSSGSTNKTVSIKKGTTIYLEASLSYSGNMNLTVNGSGKDFQAYIAKPKSGGLQTLAMSSYVTKTSNAKLTAKFQPRGVLQLQKTSSAPDITNNNSCYSLANAKFNIYTDKNCKNYYGYIVTDEKGFGKFGSGADGKIVAVPSKLYAKEIQASKGYGLNTNTFEFTLSSKKTSDGVPIYSFTCTEPVQNDPLAILVQKTNGNGERLSGAKFEVCYYDKMLYTEEEVSREQPKATWYLQTDNYGEIYLDNEHLDPTKTSSPFYIPKKDRDPIIPVGTLTIRETEAPEGYEIDDTSPVIQQVTANNSGQIISLNALNTKTIPNYPSGEITTAARNAATKTNFAFTNETTTIIDTVKYRNLIANASYIAKGVIVDKETGQPILVNGKQVTAETKFTAANESGSVEVIFNFNSKGLEGKAVVVFEDLYYSDGTYLTSHKDINDGNQTITFKNPSIKTSVTATGEKNYRAVYPGEETSITDTVTYTELVPGQSYTAKGVIVDKETGQPILVNGKQVTSEKTFIANSENGSADVTFKFNTLSLAGKEIVVYETLYFNGRKIAEHTDLNDSLQTIRVVKPVISTLAYDKATNDKDIFVSDNTTIVDRVEYSNLTSSPATGTEWYRLHAVLVDKATTEVLLDENGEEITVDRVFSANTPDGTATVEFNVNTSALNTKDVVVYEYLYYKDDMLIAQHTDINDERQTVHLKRPEITTSARTTLTNSNSAYAVPNITVIDTVSYKDLKIGAEYVVKGVAVYKNGEEVIIDDNNVTAETAFKTTKSDGTVDVKFNFDASDLRGTDIVIFERLYLKGHETELASHCDVDDKKQTITFKEPDLETVATDKLTEAHTVYKSENTTIVDKITYTGLIPNLEYTLSGFLMDRNGQFIYSEYNAETGTGKRIVAQRTFTPTAENGEVEMKFTFDSRNLTDWNGKPIKDNTVVVNQTLKYEKTSIAYHADPYSETQAVTFAEPDIKTTAKDKDTNEHEAFVNKDTTIIDTVDCKGLIIGKTYDIIGVLMDKATGKPILDEGHEVTGKTTFTATAVNQSVDVKFTFNSSALYGKEVVVFETLFFSGLNIAVHQDINDIGQTIIFKNPKIHTTATDSVTNTHKAHTNTTTTIKDKIDYFNLIPNKEYTVEGVLMSKKTGEPLLVDGKQVTAEKSFTPQTANGSVEIEFTFNSRGLEGQTVVAFEKVYFKNIEVAVHADINDDDQSVEFANPTIKTTATDNLTKGHEAFTLEDITITDKVELADLIAGETYKISGVLMDKETAEPLKVNYKLITASATFEATAGNETINLEYKLNALELDGKDVVVFETLYNVQNGVDVEAAKHCDINDEKQTVKFKKPEIKTTAVDKETNTHTAKPSKSTTIVDTVSYKNLTVGKKYTLNGEVMSKATGKVLMINNKPVTNSLTFIPTEKDGKVDIEFTFDSTGLAGNEYVVFEKVFLDNIEVAAHTDIEDKSQTFNFKEPEKPTEPPTGTITTEGGDSPKMSTSTAETGDKVPMWLIYSLIGILAAVGGIIIFLSKKKKSSK